MNETDDGLIQRKTTTNVSSKIEAKETISTSPLVQNDEFVKQFERFKNETKKTEEPIVKGSSSSANKENNGQTKRKSGKGSFF